MFNNQMIQNNNKKKIIIILKKMIKVILMQLYKLVKDGYQIQNINTIQIFKTKKGRTVAMYLAKNNKDISKEWIHKP